MKAVIVAAGYGTRFLPVSKTVPKEMFPLVNIPCIDLIINEFIESGIKDILIITSRRKKILEDYFDREVELETFFLENHSLAKLQKIKPVDANIHFIRQKKMQGTGQALLLAKSFVGDSPFVVAYPDDIFIAETPVSQSMIDIYNKTGNCVMAMKEYDGDVSRYGVFDLTKTNDEIFIHKIIEKPEPGTQPSQFISLARYLFTPKLFTYLTEDFEQHKGGEFYHISAINRLANEGRINGLIVNATYLDTGEPFSYLKSIFEYSLLQKDLKQKLIPYLKKRIKDLTD